MNFYVADIGNSRLKWGRCSGERVEQGISLPLDRPDEWATQATQWRIAAGAFWLVASVNPQRLADLTRFLQERGQRVETITGYRQLPLTVDVEQPAGVGLDRLLDAVALIGQDEVHFPAVIIDAGSAVTVDLVDAGPVFRGGAILPGLRLMAEALHHYTAQLPLVELREANPPVLGRSTVQAMTSGIHAAVVGAVLYLCQRYGVSQTETSVILTGGDAPILAPALRDMGMSLQVATWLTLEGLRVVGLRLFLSHS